MNKSHAKAKRIVPGDVQFAIRQLICLYVAAIALLLPLLFHNNYIDIATNKYTVYMTLTCIAGSAAAAYVIFYITARSLKARKLCFPDWKLSRHDKYVLAFLAVNVISCLLSSDPALSFSGLRGRKTGLLFMILLCCTYFLVSRVPEAKPYAIAGLMISGMIASVLGILNFLGFDPLHMYVNLVPIEHEMFISTVGNRNFFGAFLCLYVPVCMALCVFPIPERFESPGNEMPRISVFGVEFSNRVTGGLYRLACVSAWLGVLIGFAAVIAGRSDSAFAGMGIMLVALCLMSLRSWERFARLLWMCTLLLLAVVAMQPLYGMNISKALDMPPSVSESLLLEEWLRWLFIPLFTVLALVEYARRKNASLRILRGVRRLAVVVVVLALLCVFAAMAYFSLFDMETPLEGNIDFFRFNDYWGNFRGYIWQRSIECFSRYSFLQKIFGCGPDMVRSVMYANYGEEMLKVTGAYFDNCHNEYLQYLMTAGILGVSAYMALLGSLAHSLRRALRRGAHAAGVLLLPLIAYAVQATFNLNQTTTTPLFFLWLALAGGYLRSEGEKK